MPSVRTYTIGEAAERSGFTASALRYYEGIGLVQPATRTGAGYRLYDDEALARLAFVSRAKQLGCSLEEITDLVGIWDGERCGPVQRRFHELVTDKLAAAERQIAELAALTDQLRHAASLLAGPAIDGPCSAECACAAIERAAVELTSGRDDRPRRTDSAIVGVGAAACAACCAGPILAFLGGLGVAGMASTLFIGAAGLVLAVAAATAASSSSRRAAASAPYEVPRWCPDRRHRPELHAMEDRDGPDPDLRRHQADRLHGRSGRHPRAHRPGRAHAQQPRPPRAHTARPAPALPRPRRHRRRSPAVRRGREGLLRVLGLRGPARRRRPPPPLGRPPVVDDFFDQLQELFEGDEPITAFSGLL